MAATWEVQMAQLLASEIDRAQTPRRYAGSWMVTAQGEDGVFDPRARSQAMADLFWLMLGRMSPGGRLTGQW